jgi:sarcosine oxidase subunit gamma
MPIAARFHSTEVERQTLATLAMCDLSALPKLGVKGASAERFLAEQSIDTPDEVYESQLLADNSLIVRVGSDEFFLEAGVNSETVSQVAAALESSSLDCIRVERQEATFLLIGSRVFDVMAQTCGINLREAPSGKALYTRVAGVSCCVFPGDLEGHPTLRIWVDNSYALYLWESLVEIIEELDGTIVGAASLYPDSLE